VNELTLESETERKTSAECILSERPRCVRVPEEHYTLHPGPTQYSQEAQDSSFTLTQTHPFQVALKKKYKVQRHMFPQVSDTHTHTHTSVRTVSAHLCSESCTSTSGLCNSLSTSGSVWLVWSMINKQPGAPRTTSLMPKPRTYYFKPSSHQLLLLWHIFCANIWDVKTRRQSTNWASWHEWHVI